MKKQLFAACALVSLISAGSSALASNTALPERTPAPDAAAATPPARANAGTTAPIWGAGAAVGSSDGEFANPFVQAGSFAQGDNPTSWTALSVNQSSGSVSPGNAYWTRSLTGRSQGAYAGGMAPVASPSQANGVAIFDSDYLDNGGVAGAFGTGPSPSAHEGALISPRIDLTGYTDEPLSVSLYSRYREFDITELSVSISTDDGGTWSSPVDYRQFIASNTEGFVKVDFLNATAGVANLSQCRVKLVFSGDYYYAIVDDLSVQPAIEYDLALGVFDSNGNSLQEQGDVVHFTGNRYFPISQLSPDARHFGFGGTIRNLGAREVPPTDNPVLTLTIEKDEGGTWSTVFSDSIAATDPIPVGGYVSLVDLVTDYSWVSTGDFRATYTVSLDQTDGVPGNNALTHLFSITPNDYASKVDVDMAADPLATSAVFPGGGPFNAVEYGSVFYFAAATASELRLDAISFTYRLSSSFSPNDIGADQTLEAFVYAVDPSTGVLTDRNLLELVGSCEMSLVGLGTSVLPGEYGYATCIPADVTTSQPTVALNDGHYFISLRIEPGMPFDSTDVPWFGTSNLKNYYYNIAQTTPGMMVNVSPVAVTDASSTETWYWSGFGARIVPSIGIDFSLPDAIFANGFEAGPGTP